MAILIALPFIVAAAIAFIVINVMTPTLYDLWFNNLSDEVSQSNLRTYGANMFGAFQIMAYVVPGLLILAAFAAANSRRSREEAL